MKDKFRIWRKTNSVNVVRNGRVELEIHTKQPALIEKYLRKVLPQDYFEYLNTYNLQYSIHTSEWFINHISKYLPDVDEEGNLEPDIRFLFSRIVPVGLKVEEKIAV